MTCGLIPLNPQIISTAMAMLGQPTGLPADLSLVMNGAQPEIRAEVLCESGKPVGWSVERYFDTKTPITKVVELDDGEVDEQTAYVMIAADGRVSQKLTVRLDSGYKLAQFSAEAQCAGNNPNALVCTTHVPTIQALGLGASKGAHVDWMQTLVPEVEAGGEYVFVSAAEYPQAKKEAEDKKKAAANPPAPSAPPSATAPIPLIPSGMTSPPVAPKDPADSKTGGQAVTSPDTPVERWVLIGLGGLGLLVGIGWYLGRRGQSNVKNGESAPPISEKKRIS